MIKITVKIIIMTILVVASCAFILKMPVRYSHDLSQIIQKKEILAGTPSPKIVFVGGSNLLAGLDSRLVRERLHYNVVNMGLYQGFGISFLLEQAKPYINSGDIVVIVPEYTLLLIDGYFWPFDEHAIKWSLALSPASALKEIYIKRVKLDLLLKSASELCRDKLLALTKCIASRNLAELYGHGYLYGYRHIDKSGDARHYTEKKVPLEKMEWYGYKYKKSITDASKINDMNEFHSFVRSRNAQVYFLFSIYPQELFDANREAFSNSYEQLRKQLKFSVLGKPDDFTYPIEYFTDTPNHLSQVGKQVRTEKIIELLGNELKAASGHP